MLHKVCRAYHNSPDDVRGWDYDDFLDALEGLGEVPLVDESFYAAFAGGGHPRGTGPSLTTAKGRRDFLEQLEQMEQTTKQAGSKNG